MTEKILLPSYLRGHLREVWPSLDSYPRPVGHLFTDFELTSYGLDYVGLRYWDCLKAHNEEERRNRELTKRLREETGHSSSPGAALFLAISTGVIRGKAFAQIYEELKDSVLLVNVSGGEDFQEETFDNFCLYYERISAEVFECRLPVKFLYLINKVRTSSFRIEMKRKLALQLVICLLDSFIHRNYGVFAPYRVTSEKFIEFGDIVMEFRHVPSVFFAGAILTKEEKTQGTAKQQKHKKNALGLWSYNSGEERGASTRLNTDYSKAQRLDQQERAASVEWLKGLNFKFSDFDPLLDLLEKIELDDELRYPELPGLVKAVAEDYYRRSFEIYRARKDMKDAEKEVWILNKKLEKESVYV